MNVFVATNETQGVRKSDFCHAPEGELLTFTSMECDSRIDGPCGCKRSLIGVESRRATTTMKVVDMDITVEEYAKKILGNVNDFVSSFGKELADFAKEEAEELLRLASRFNIGDIVEKRGKMISIRE